MATLTINGRQVTVSDDFLNLSPEEQESTVDEIAASLGNAGPSPEMQSGLSELSRLTQAAGDGSGNALGGMRAAAEGFADTATFGLADEAAAGIGALGGMLPGGHGKDFDSLMREIMAQRAQNNANHPIAATGGAIAGALGGGLGLARGGLSLGANAARGGASLGRVAAGGSVDGAIAAGLYGFGSGDGLADRAKNAALSAPIGAGVGLAAPYAVAGLSAASRPFVAPIMARLRPQGYAERAMSEGMRRAGASADDIAGRLQNAGIDDQGMFNVADAMGHSGQRMLSTIARNPGDMRQTVAETLQHRQIGQGQRLARALAEGFGAPDTAAQRASGLTAARTAAADVNYTAARQGAVPVDVSAAIAAADDVLSPGVNRVVSQGSNIADDSLEGAVRRARSLLASGNDQITDFNSVLRARQDISDMIGAAQRAGQNNRVRILSRINRALDAALERASAGYRAANDTFAAQSRAIDAIDAGAAATSGRARAADNIRQFGAMAPEEQAAFRAGYADPLIARVEAASTSPTTNKARVLTTEKFAQEFPAFAAQGQGGRMGRRIAREQRMFETANAALGGSKTADNLADAAEMSKFEPGVMMNLLRGRPVAAAVDAVMGMVREAQGMPPAVMDRIARMLLETRPDVARAMLRGAMTRRAASDGRRALANAILTNMGAVGSARAGAR